MWCCPQFPGPATKRHRIGAAPSELDADRRVGPAGGTVSRSGGTAVLAGYSIAVVSSARHQLSPLLEAAGARSVAVQGVRAYSTVDVMRGCGPRPCACWPPRQRTRCRLGFGFVPGFARPGDGGWPTPDRPVRRPPPAASTRAPADAIRETGLDDIWSTAAGSTRSSSVTCWPSRCPDGGSWCRATNQSVAELCTRCARSVPMSSR